MNYLIIPGFLTSDLREIKENMLLFSGVVPRVSVDIIDGLFVDNITVGVEELSEVDWGDTTFELQLMVEEPFDYLEQADRVGAARVFGHIERMGDRGLFLERALQYSFEVGWGFDVYTPVDQLSDEELEKVSGILLMSVKAGYSGQKHIDIRNKIKRLRSRGFQGDIVIDGGLNFETIPPVLQVGANQFSLTSAVLKAEDPVSEWKKYMELITKEVAS